MQIECFFNEAYEFNIELTCFIRKVEDLINKRGLIKSSFSVFILEDGESLDIPDFSSIEGTNCHCPDFGFVLISVQNLEERAVFLGLGLLEVSKAIVLHEIGHALDTKSHNHDFDKMAPSCILRMEEDAWEIAISLGESLLSPKEKEIFSIVMEWCLDTYR